MSTQVQLGECLGQNEAALFVAETAHDLQAPLSVVHGFIATLLERWGELTDEMKLDMLQRADEQTMRASRLASDLLDLSRLDAGHLPVHVRTTRVRPLLETCVDAVGPQAIDIRVSCPQRLRARADAAHLERILINLLGNALSHGAPPITIEATRHDHRVEIVVCDAGPGVVPRDRGRLFDRFSRDETVPGAGLGLAIVRELAEAQGGAVWYEPACPGSRFGVHLPLAG